MTAGRGILHCEMPEGDGLAHGLQLWVNLSRVNKMTEPAYQELLDKDIPRTTKEGVTVKAIAGESLGIKVINTYFSGKYFVYVSFMFSKMICYYLSRQ